MSDEDFLAYPFRMISNGNPDRAAYFEEMTHKLFHKEAVLEDFIFLEEERANAQKFFMTIFFTSWLIHTPELKNGSMADRGKMLDELTVKELEPMSKMIEAKCRELGLPEPTRQDKAPV